MKKHLLALMILCFSIGLKSENYHPFPTENAIWHALGFDFSKEHDPKSKIYSHKYFVNGDTIIENETWQKIYFINNYLGNIDFKSEMNYVAAIRENQQKQILAKFPQLPEFVLYDFSLQIGDTIWYEYAAFSGVSSSYPIYFDMEDKSYAPHYKVVVDKDSILLKNGHYRNRLILHSFSEHYGNLHIHNHWIEGFGCTHWSGLFHPIDIIRCGKCAGFAFVCFMQDEEVLFLDNPYCDDCLCETFTSADYHPFPEENAIWHAIGTNFFDEKLYSYKFKIENDTIIDDENWLNVYWSIQNLDDAQINDFVYFASIRENDDRQILIKSPDYPAFVLYDFSLDVGDTIWYDYATGFIVGYGIQPLTHLQLIEEEHHRVVLEKDSVLLANGQYRSQLTLYGYEAYGFYQNQTKWVEGMGSIDWIGLVHPLIPDYFDNGDHIKFVCFKQDEEVLYLDNPYCDDCLCETVTSIDHVENTDEIFTVFPNPGKGDLTIKINENSSRNLALKIIDISGKKLFEKHLLNQQEINLNLGAYKSGFYIIQILDMSSRKMLESKKIIIE